MTATAAKPPYILRIDAEVDDSESVETVEQLRAALNVFRDAVYFDLTETYVVERVKEVMSDGTVKHSIRIREA